MSRIHRAPPHYVKLVLQTDESLVQCSVCENMVSVYMPINDCPGKTADITMVEQAAKAVWGDTVMGRDGYSWETTSEDNRKKMRKLACIVLQAAGFTINGK